MTSISQLLMNRELGLPRTRIQISRAIDRKIADNLAKDCFDSKTIKLSDNSFHRTFRCQNFVAILSMNKTGQKIQTLALCSLITQGKLWELEINSDYKGTNPGNCQLSEKGLILIESPSTKEEMIIFFNGKQTGVLPSNNWYSTTPEGNRILTHWGERIDPNNKEICWLPRNTIMYFGEWDHQGKLLKRIPLDFKNGRSGHANYSDKNYWVRLSGSNDPNLSSIIEVYDRVIQKMNTFKLPINKEEEKFSSVCIVQNQLFFGKNIIRPWSQYKISVSYDPRLYVFDLLQCRIIESYRIGREKGEIKGLFGTEHYIVWYETGGSEISVSYLDLLKKKIMHATNVQSCVDANEIWFDISQNLLSITSGEGYWNTGWAIWQRKVVDMTTGELKVDVQYKRYPWGECTMSSGNLLITDYFSNASRLYIENFVSGTSKKDDFIFRQKLTY